MSILERIAALRSAMKKNDVYAYLVPSADFHQTEYVGEHFKARAFITGFTGSAGTALITESEAFLWTDGRYFIQAEAQLQNSGVTLCKMGEPGVPTITEYLKQSMPEGSVLGFDGRVVSVAGGIDYEAAMSEIHGSIKYELDFISEIWDNRPELSKEMAFHLDIKYSGESTESKLARIREKMAEVSATAHIITTLDDLCWTFNFRGDDVKYSPMVLGYAIIYMDKVELFIDTHKLTDEIHADLSKNQVVYLPYNDIYDKVKSFTAEDTILLDPANLNYALYSNLPTAVTRVEKPTPSILMKAIKNDVELENIRIAHIKDGVAITKFMYWLKSNIGSIEIDELSASDKLASFREEQTGYIRPSFAPICAYKEHAALCHYESTPETNIPLQTEGLFLTDTGGNYYEGSTDITRTFALGALTADEKMHYTTVAKSMLNLTAAKFLEGNCGFNLDILARQPFWDLDLDYNHGTGHGVGYLLSIHEGPAGIHWNRRNTVNTALTEGMILTNEPGLYIGGSHGIRIENELVIRKGTKNEYGQFMYFETITFAPIDLDAIDTSLLSELDKTRLNAYHMEVWDKISPYLTSDEQAWLKTYTRAV